MFAGKHAYGLECVKRKYVKRAVHSQPVVAEDTPEDEEGQEDPQVVQELEDEEQEVLQATYTLFDDEEDQG